MNKPDKMPRDNADCERDEDAPEEYEQCYRDGSLKNECWHEEGALPRRKFCAHPDRPFRHEGKNPAE